MDVSEVQNWVKENLGNVIGSKSVEWGLATYFEQGGQLSEALLHPEERDVTKEFADNLLVLFALAAKKGVDFTSVIQSHILSKSAEDVFSNLNA